MTARIIEERFSHTANGGGCWYVMVRGTYEEVTGEAGKTIAKQSALAAGWNPGGRADAGWPSRHNLDEDDRVFSFYGQELWAHHLDCWCRHSFCPHAQQGGRGGRCDAPAPYTKVAASV